MNYSTENRSGRWLPALLAAAAGAAVFQFFGNASFGYIKSASLFWWWGYQWFNAESETEHGIIILAVSAWLLWRNLRGKGKVEMRKAKGESVWPAAVAMSAGLALHVVGFAAQQARVSVVALLLFTWGVLRLGGGRRWGAAALFPLGFLLLAIPVNALDSASFWLRLWVIKASTGLAHTAGIGVLQNGTQLLAPDGHYSYDVAPACSGVRSLVALLALSLLIGYLNFRGAWRRIAMVLMCFPLIYLGNVARISSIIFVANWAGQARGGQAHDIMGVGVFVIVLGGLVLLAELIHRRWPEAPRAAQEAGSREQGAGKTGTGAWILAVVIVVLAVGEMFFLARLASLPSRGQVGVQLAADGQNPVALPAYLGTEWVGRAREVTAAEREILPPDTGYSRKFYESVADRTKGVFLSIVLSGRDRSSIHRPELCVVGQGWTIKAVSGHRFSAPGGAAGEIPATVLQVQREVRTSRGPIVVPQLIVYWFVGGDTIESNYWRRLARDAWNRVAHARADRWAYVLLQTDARDGEAAALARMQAVLNETWPGFARGGAAGGSGK